jgi:hydrogenase expression/formation protein HypC
MCLAVPGQLLRIESGPLGVPTGAVSFGGITKPVCLAYVPEARVGDYVLVHVGFALGVIGEDEAREVFRTLRAMGATEELEAPGT